MFKQLVIFYIFFVIISCQTKRYNYVNYYNNVNEADSILRIQKDSLSAIVLYKSIFKKYSPKQTDQIEEFETYIKISDKLHKDFGGKSSLYKLLPLVAPNWKYKKQDEEFISLYKKYGIDSLEIEQEINNWKKGLNRTLVDSFSVAIVRDQQSGRTGGISKKNDKKNEQLLIWTFNNFGYPSQQKIGLWGNNGVFMPSGLILHHMAASDKYSYFKEKVFEYVKSGDCPPDDYASMVERNNNLNHKESEFGYESMFGLKPLNNRIDTVKVNKNRKAIGLPSLKHSKKLSDDFSKR